MSAEAPDPKDGEVLGPNTETPQSQVGDSYIALISQYTERPDLLIGELEKHDPGFIRRMNEQAEQRNIKMSNVRFRFGGIQAYAGLTVSIIAASTVLGILAFAVVQNTAGFWLIVGLAVFYAVSQGGPSGFVELCRGVAAFFRKDSNDPD